MEEIGAMCRARKVFFHTDAAQAVGKVPVNVDDMKVDLMSISAHKLYGPKGVGALGPCLYRLQKAGTHAGGTNVPGSHHRCGRSACRRAWVLPVALLPRSRTLWRCADTKC